MQQKRLIFHPRQLSKQYANSEYQFIKEKQQNVGSDEKPIPKNMSTPMNRNAGMSVVYHDLGDSNAGKLNLDKVNDTMQPGDQSQMHAPTPYFVTEHIETVNDIARSLQKDNEDPNVSMSDKAMTEEKQQTFIGNPTITQ